MSKWDLAYLDVVHRFSQLSTAVRLKVGAIVVKSDRIISIGYNGMPSGWDNSCEYYLPSSIESWMHPEDHSVYGELVTKEEVIHAEANCIAKLAKGNEGGEGSVMYSTHAPCLDCAKQIYGAGIIKVIYSNEYRSTSGIEFLENCGIGVEQA